MKRSTFSILISIGVGWFFAGVIGYYFIHRGWFSLLTMLSGALWIFVWDMARMRYDYKQSLKRFQSQMRKLGGSDD